MGVRSRFWVVGSLVVGAGIACGGTMVGCSGDDTVVPDASTDATADQTNDVIITPDTGPDVKDGGFDAPPDAPYDSQPIKDFISQQVANTCTRYSQCCFGGDAGAFDTAKCKDLLKNGVDFNLRPFLEAPQVLDKGRLALDQTAVTACLAEVLTFSCPTAQATELSKTAIDCFSAVRGTQSVGQPCDFNIECKGGICIPNGPDAGSDAGTGTCGALKANGTGPCGLRNEECQDRGYIGAPARCDVQKAPDGGPASFTCQARVANGVACTYNWECQSGTCDFATGKCQASTVTVSGGVCNALTIKDAGGGG